MLTPKDLKYYQKFSITKLLNNPFFALLLDMGLGKTVITLTAIHRLINWDLSVEKVLIVAPKRVARDVWPEEVKAWSHLKDLKVIHIGGTEKQRLKLMREPADIYTISRDNIVWLCLQHNFKLPYCMAVIDESSSFKNAKSKRFKALRKSIASVPRVALLTGTPAPNSLLDLWAQIYLLDRGERLGETMKAYTEEFFRPGDFSGHVVYNYKTRKGAEEKIYEAISDISVSMKAKDFIVLPERLFIDLPVSMPDSIAKKYKAFERDQVIKFIESGAEVNALNAAALITKLRQFSNGFMYDEDKTVHRIHDLKIEALEELIEASQGKPIFVAWQFKADKDRILEHFKKLAPRELKTSQDIKDWNDGKIKLLISHPASAGHGLNLQKGGSIIAWYGLDWSLELYEQFNKRLHRPGQKDTCYIYRILLKGTEDARIAKTLEGKSNTQEGLLAALKAKINAYK